MRSVTASTAASSDAKTIRGALLLAVALAAIFVLGSASAAMAGEFPICTRAGDQKAPKVSGTKVVYEDAAGSGGGDIYMYDLASKTEHAVTTEAHKQSLPRISGSYVIWNDGRDAQQQVYYQSLSIADTDHRLTGPTSSGDYQSPFDIWGDTVAFHTRYPLSAPFTWGYYVYSKKVGGAATVLASDAQIYDNMAFGGKWIAIDQRTSAGVSYVHTVAVIPIAGGAKRVIAGGSGVDARFPDTWGDRVVYEDNRSGSFHIYMYDLSTNTERQITSRAGDQMRPAISGDIIVWADHPDGYAHNAAGYIWMYDLRTGATRQLSTAHSAFNPDVSGNFVVWADDRTLGAGDDIYGYDLSVPDTFTQWTKRVSGTTQPLYAVDFVDSNTGWAVGSGGTILKTKNGGATWAAQSSGAPAADLSGVDFVSSMTGWAVGFDRPANSAVILKTTNGGTTWVGQAHYNPISAWPNDVLAVSASTVFGFGGGDGSKLPRQNLFWTDNGGATWASHASAPASTNLFGVSKMVAQGSGNYAWAVGWPDAVLKTTDMGATWTPVSHPGNGLNRLMGAAVMTGNSAIVVGDAAADTVSPGQILRTIDGGTNWTQPTPPTTQQLRGADAMLGNVWVVGEGGTIYHSGDYGANWGSQANPAGANAIWDVYVWSPDRICAVGTNGTILTGARPFVTLSAPTVPAVKRGVYFTTYGYLKPRHTGVTKLYFQRYNRGFKAYKTVNAKNANFSTYTKYSLKYKLPYAGKWRVRAYFADADHQPTYSAYKTFTVS
jgi:beta propeller repeat protein